MTTSVEELGREIALIKRQLAGLAQPQLANSSLEDAAINEYDRDGLLGSIFGTQYDGTHGVVPVSGPIPPVPANITAESVPNGVVVHWPGEYVPLPPPYPGMAATPQVAPLDFQLVEVHASTDANFTGLFFETKRQEIVSARGGEVFIPVGPDVAVYIRLVTRTTAGKRSLPSAIVGPVLGGSDPLIADAAQLAADAQARAEQAIADAATAQAAADAAEASAGAVAGDVAIAQQAADDAAGQAAAALTAAQNAASTGTSAQQAADTAAAAAAAAQEAADAAGTAAAQADADAAAAAATAAQAVADAAAAATAAGTAQTSANNALTAANGRNRIFTQATKPSGTGYIKGDLWIDTANGRRLSAWDPSANSGAGDFVIQQFGNSAIAPGTLIGTDVFAEGTISGALLKADAIDGKTITGATFRTGASGARLELTTANGLRGFAADGTTVNTQLTTDGKLTAKGATIIGVIQTAESGARVRIAQTTNDGAFSAGVVEFLGQEGIPSPSLRSYSTTGRGSLTLSNGNSGSVSIDDIDIPAGGFDTTVTVTAQRARLIGTAWDPVIGRTDVTYPDLTRWGPWPVTTGDSYDTAHCWKDASGTVHCSGLVYIKTAGAWGGGAVICQLPVGMRPAKVEYFILPAFNTSTLTGNVYPDGTLRWAGSGPNTVYAVGQALGLSGIKFRPA